MRAFDVASAMPWTIMSSTLEDMLQVAARDGEGPDALAAKLGRKLDNTREVQMRDGVAVIPVVGPIFRYANFFFEVCGGVSTEILARDISTALENPAVKGIVLDIDSPGGEATGINELAKMIAAGAKRKPIVAYGGGLVASGAYWLASAAGEIVGDETAMFGSIGVVITARKREGEGRHVEIVSSQSPKKRVDVGQESGRAEIQRVVDDLAQIFVGAVATNRGVSEEKVLSDFGKGGLLLTGQARQVGMVDRIGTLEGVIAELQQRAAGSPGLRSAAKSKGATTMSEQNRPAEGAAGTGESVERPPAPTAVDVQAAIAAALRADRTRQASITGSEEAKGREGLASHLALNTELTAEQAVEVLKASPKQEATKQAGNALEQAMAGVKNPDISPGKDKNQMSEDEESVAFLTKTLGAKEGN